MSVDTRFYVPLKLSAEDAAWVKEQYAVLREARSKYEADPEPRIPFEEAFADLEERLHPYLYEGLRCEWEELEFLLSPGFTLDASSGPALISGKSGDPGLVCEFLRALLLHKKGGECAFAYSYVPDEHDIGINSSYGGGTYYLHYENRFVFVTNVDSMDNADAFNKCMLTRWGGR